jgi:N6-adenosine-specific RNA methylase IME4
LCALFEGNNAGIAGRIQGNGGMGSYTKSNIEICLLGMRGHIKSADKTVPQILLHKRLAHSVKPPIVRDRIVQLFGNLSRIELFARQKIDGWDSIGYDIDGMSVQDKIEILKSMTPESIPKGIIQRHGESINAQELLFFK